MSEKIGESFWPIMAKETIHHSGLRSVFEQGGFKAAGSYFLELLKAQVDYIHESAASFWSDRAKLQTKPGLIISNHPGYVEIPAILQTIERRDLKIMVNQVLYEEFSREFGRQYFIPNVKTRPELIKNIKTIIEHIQQGGAFMIFPDGGHKSIRPGQPPQFMGGFRALLNRLRPDDMIYSFFINPEQSEGFRRSLSQDFSGLVLAKISQDKFDINDHKEVRRFAVDENYSEASEWQSLLKSKNSNNSQGDNALLTENYYRKFRSGF